MKKIFTYFFIVMLGITAVKAQTGLNGINYQAVARNTNGTVLANQPVKVKLSILGGSANGPVQYQENHSLTTNQLGLFTLQIGKGTVATGTFAAVPWQNANQYLKVELALGAVSYADLGTTQLMSVPYALYAANGNPGPQGATGAAGPQGLPGIQGPAGAVGPAGPAGINGVAGLNGAKGDQGIPGTAGAKGDKGDKGEPGGPFTLPYAAVETNSSPLFYLSNQGNGAAIAAQNEANGYAIDAKASTTGIALRAQSNDGNALQVKSINGVGAYVESTKAIAAKFENTSALNTVTVDNFGAGSGIKTVTKDGIAVIAENTSSSNPSLSAKNNNAAGIALKTEGRVQLTGIAEGAGKILTSDAAGNASWHYLPAVSPTTKVTSIPGVALVSSLNDALVRVPLFGALWIGMKEETPASTVIYAPVTLPDGAVVKNIKAVFYNAAATECTVTLYRSAFTSGGIVASPSPNVATLSLMGPMSNTGSVNKDLSHVVANTGATYYITVTSEGYGSIVSPGLKVWTGAVNFRIAWIEITYTN